MKVFWWILQVMIAASFIYWCDTHLPKAQRGLGAEIIVGMLLGFLVMSSLRGTGRLLLRWLRRKWAGRRIGDEGASKSAALLRNGSTDIESAISIITSQDLGKIR